MGPTRRSARLADHVVLVGAIASISESVPRRVAEALGGGADLRVALSESAIQSRLRAAVHYQRGAYLRRDGSPHAPEVGPILSFQTVFSWTPWTSQQRRHQPQKCPSLGSWRRFAGICSLWPETEPTAPIRTSCRCRIPPSPGRPLGQKSC